MTVPFQLLQIADSACPTGGFAHSYGVEELFQGRDVVHADDLLDAIATYVVESLAGRELVFVALAWDAASSGSSALLHELAHQHVATRLTRTTRDAERTRGRALHRTLEAIHGPSPLWDAAAGSYAVLFGAAGAVFGAERGDVLRAGGYAHVSAMTQAAVRLGRIGPRAAEEILGRLSGPLATAVADSNERRFGDWYGFAPLWELAQARHEHRDTAMFVT